MVRITRSIDFASSLRLRHPELDAAANECLYGALARRHGHNYRLEVTLAGEPDASTGMLIDLKQVKELLEREVMARFDHRDLVDDTPYFEKQPATLEHFALLLHRLLSDALPPGQLHGIRLREDPDSWVEVRS